MEKDAIINFLLKQKSETNGNTSSINKTAAENDETQKLKEITPAQSSNTIQKKKNSNRTFE